MSTMHQKWQCGSRRSPLTGAVKFIPRRPNPRPPQENLDFHVPLHEFEKKILEHVNANVLTVVQGADQYVSVRIPQIVLDCEAASRKDAFILVVEPASSQARSFASHVAGLRNRSSRNEVSFVIDSSSYPHHHDRPQIIYTTPSVLFEWLLQSKELWDMITHLILDRADSRTIDQDLLCLLIKLNFLNDHPSAVKRRKKFIILSGALGHCHLELYFSFLINKNLYKPVVISRTIKLPNVIYLEDLIKEFNTLPAKGVQLVNTLQRLPATGKNIPQVVFDLLAEIIMSQAKNGDSFVICLPGIRELYLLKHRISRLDYINEKLILRVSLLHQMSTWAEQEEIFKFDPRQVNVILTTSFENIILLPRVKYVIDLGLERVCNFDLKRGMNVMVTNWTNRSSLRQRESQGLSDIVIRVFSKHTYEALQEQGIPEMRRSRLSYVLLRMKEKMHKLGQIETLCQQLPDPPTSIALKQAMKYLNDTGAIEGHSLNAITLNEVGRLALRLSVDADISRLILLGLRLCCSVESVIIAAGLTLPVELFTKPQIFQLGSSEEFEHELGYITGRRLYDMGKHNDMMIFCSVYCKWLNESSWDKEWIHETFVNVDSLHFLVSRVQFLASGLKRFLEEEGVMKAMEGQYQKLVELSMVDDNHQSCNRSWIFCSNFHLILLTIAAAFSSSIISGTIPNPMLAEKESLQITALGLDPDRTFKISNVPAELLANFEDFQKALLIESQGLF